MNRQEIRDQVRFATLKETGDISDAELNTLIDAAFDEISVAFKWPFLEKSTTVSTVASQQTYSLPADFLYGVALVDDDNDTTVPYIAPGLYFQRYGNDTGNTATTADRWTIWESKIYLSPIPSAADTNRYSFYYYRTITKLADDVTEPEFHAAFHPAIVEYCKWKVWEREEIFEQAQVAFALFKSYLDSMHRFYSSQVAREPYIWGDGVSFRIGDPNIPWLYRV